MRCSPGRGHCIVRVVTGRICLRCSRLHHVRSITSGVGLLCGMLTPPAASHTLLRATRSRITETHTRKVSPDKNVNVRCTTGPFTTCAEPKGFDVLCRLTPRNQPPMAFLFVGSHLCTPASSPPNLAVTQLPSACTFVFMVLCTGDFHPISSRPCRAYTNGLSERSASAGPGS